MNTARDKVLPAVRPRAAPRPDVRTLVQAARAVIADRVRNGVATPAERLSAAVLDEMPDEGRPDAGSAGGSSAAFREAVDVGCDAYGVRARLIALALRLTRSRVGPLHERTAPPYRHLVAPRASLPARQLRAPHPVSVYPFMPSRQKAAASEYGVAPLLYASSCAVSPSDTLLDSPLRPHLGQYPAALL